MPSLQELPLPLAIIVAAFWIIQQANTANAKQIVALIDAFDRQYNVLVKDYQALVQMAMEDRLAVRQRWLERDRLLSERLDRNTEECTQNKTATHTLRGTIQVVAATVELIARELGTGRGPQRGAGESGGSDD